jgi:hypothetical protein
MPRKRYCVRKTRDAPPLPQVVSPPWEDLIKTIMRAGIRKHAIANSIGLSGYLLDTLLDSGVVHRGKQTDISWICGQRLLTLHNEVTLQKDI